MQATNVLRLQYIAHGGVELDGPMRCGVCGEFRGQISCQSWSCYHLNCIQAKLASYTTDCMLIIEDRVKP